MGEIDCLRFGVSLQNSSSLSIATRLWDSPSVKKDVKKYCIQAVKDQDNVHNSELRWREVIKRVQKKVELLKLPSKIICEVQQYIVFTGEKIFLWFLHIVTGLSLNYKFALNVHWTEHGIIDESRIFQEWKVDPTFPSLPDKIEDKILTYALACAYVDIDFLNKNLVDIAQSIRDYIGLKIKNMDTFKVNSAMAILLTWYIVDQEKKTDNSVEFALMYSSLKSSKYKAGFDKLFLHCVSCGLDKAAEFFYNKLKKEDQPEILKQAALVVIKNSSKEINHTTEKNAELLFYIMNKMNMKQKKDFLMEKLLDVYIIFLNTWPYQQLCPALLDYVWDKLFFNYHMAMLEKTYRILKCFSKNRNKMFMYVLRPIWRDVLGRCDAYLKGGFFHDMTKLWELFQIGDYESIKIVIDDPGLWESRSMFMNLCEFFGPYLIDGGSFDCIKEYAAVLNLKKKEIKNILEYIADDGVFVRKLLSLGRFELVEDLMKYYYEAKGKDPAKRMKEIRAEWVEPVEIIAGLIESDNFDLIDNYLKWQYGDDEETAKETKSKIFELPYIRERFWNVWIKNRGADLKTAKTKTTSFLKNIFKTTEEVTTFKKEQLIEDENFLKIMFKSEATNLFSVAEIFEFCMIPAEKISLLKRKVKNNLDQLLNEYGTFPSHFMALNALIEWVSDTEKEKKSIIRKHINSSNGAWLCYHFLSNYVNEDFVGERKEVLSSLWLKECGDFNLVKQEVRNLEGAKSHVSKSDIDRVIEKLDKIQAEGNRPRGNNLASLFGLLNF